MRRAHGGGRQTAGLDHHSRFHLDLRLYLHLPLIRRRVSRRRDHLEERLGRRLRRQQLTVRSMRRQSVAALGGADDGAAWRDDLRSRRQTLHRLIEVLVERVAGVRREHHVERRFDRLHGVVFGRRTSEPVLFEEIAREDRCNPLPPIQRHVDRKVHAGHPRNLTHIVMNGIAFGDAPRGVRVADALRIVEHEHGREARQSRRHHLRPAAEAGEKMRLHEARGDANIRIHPETIQINRHPGAGVAD